MGYLELKEYEDDEDFGIFAFCDFPGCTEEFRGKEIEISDQNWKLTELGIGKQSIRIALCDQHSDKMINFIRKKKREIEDEEEVK